MVGMVDSFSNHNRPPPPITRERQDELPEIEIPPPPNAEQAQTRVKLPPPRSLPRHKKESHVMHNSHELLLPHRRRSLRAKVLLFSIIGFGLGILVGVGFLLG